MDDQIKTYSLRYVGRRFDGARLPLDVLSDLPALRDLIAALAKQEFRRQNPDRKRVPQGFDKSISFALTEIGEGSAVPVFELNYEVAQQNLPNIGDGMEDAVRSAYERAARLFDDAANDKFPHALPQDAIHALSKLGSSIQENERIEFKDTIGSDGSVVSLDTARRKSLLTRVRKTYTVEFEDVGILTGVDATHNSIQVKTEQYGELRIVLDGVSLAEEFDGSLHSLVEFALSIALDAHDDFSAIEAVHSVDLVKPYDEGVKRCAVRLQELAKVEKGWLGDGEGEQLVHLAGLRAIQLIFTRAKWAEYFRIYPTEDGGVSIELDIEDWSFAVEVLPDGTLELDGSSSDGGVFEPKKFPGFTEEFNAEFDKMISVVSNDKN